MDFARVWEQAKDLWSRPVGKWLLSAIGLFIVGAAIFSYVWTRPTYVPLGKFEAKDAPAVAKKLDEGKIAYKNDSTFTFTVKQDDLEKARLMLAELNLDPAGVLWTADSWKGKTSWSDTEYDKRRLWVEQTETNLTRAIRALSVVDQARVQISIPMEKPLFKADEKPPKATVVVLPKKGEQLSVPVVESVMELVAGAVEGLDKKDVVVMDASRSRVVSSDAFKPKTQVGDAATDGTTLQMQIEKQFQDRWTETLTQQLEKVAGAGKVSVIVNPSINWDKVQEEIQEYKPTGADGKGVLLSEQTKKSSADGTSGGSQGPNSTGTTPNAETGVPGYPGAVSSTGGGNLSQQSMETIANYLVSQTKRITERPGGSIEEIAVGIMVDNNQVKPEAETAMKQVVATAMGSKAKVEVAALPFAPSVWDTLGDGTGTQTQTQGTPSLLYILLAVALTLGAVGFGMLALRPRKPVLEPVFAGPEAAMMGGIPVADLEMTGGPTPITVADAYAAQMGGAPTAAAHQPEEPELPALAPEEIALLGDEFLQKLGVDPAKVRMRERVEKIAKANPEAVAQLLKTWIQDA
ncbi:MAG TPA: flagellar M-ring protein FliF C-terminal domain-containing protein [Symbiobacteriaceae bacterium]|nr:flagellar M-ring protein FliF C-terminal domain-containing protein [Symbiobacteriaceae bacterium]